MLTDLEAELEDRLTVLRAAMAREEDILLRIQVYQRFKTRKGP